MSGNVAEMVEEKGIALGGSYADPSYDVRIQSEQQYTAPSQKIGFRVIAVPKGRDVARHVSTIPQSRRVSTITQSRHIPDNHTHLSKYFTASALLDFYNNL